MAVKFWYKNHRDEISERVITVDSIEFHQQGNPDYKHPPNSWVLSGYDHGKNARRSFLLDKIIIPNGTPRGVFSIPLMNQRDAASIAQKEMLGDKE
jgi:hypothetical protein